MLRRLEDRGEVRGGRFVSGFGGEQFALPEVLESLRAARNGRTPFTLTIAGSDPMNLLGVLVPGERIPAVPGKSFAYSTQANMPWRVRSESNNRFASGITKRRSSVEVPADNAHLMWFR